MRATLLFPMLLLALVISSCTSKKEKETPAPMPSSYQAPDLSNPITIDTASFRNADFTQPQGGTAAAATSGTPPANNPPHGQPFHRCDIPVGAPLNSAPAPKAQSTTPPTSTAPKITTPVTTTPVQSVPVATGPKPEKNPAHGQPYHRCDIPVGAPLDSIPPK